MDPLVVDAEASPAESVARSPLGLFAAAFVFVSLVAFSPVVNYQAWTPKAAALPLVVAAGVPVFVILVRQSESRRPAIAGAVFLGVAGLSALLSSRPWIAFFGLYGWGTGFLFCLSLMSAWAIGRALDERARADIVTALLAGSALNLLVAIGQRYFDLSSFRLQMTHGRSSGLLGNPVNLGALAAAALAVTVVTYARQKVGLWTLPVFASAALIQLAGGRIALAVVVGVLLWAVIWRGWRVAAIAAIAIALGFSAAVPVATQGGQGTTQRLENVTGSQGVSSRLENWYTARHAVAENPALGSGPGMYLEATGTLRTPRLGHLDGGDNVYADAHNIAVEYIVTTGVLGAVALGAFFFLASLRTAGPMLALALSLAISHLVQPLNVGLTPLMFLALGAAAPVTTLRYARSARASWTVLSPIGLAMMAVLLFGDHQLRQSDLDFTESQALAAERVLPKWKDTANLLSRNYLFDAITTDDEAYYDKAEAWREVGAAREPFDAPTWYRLGDLQLRRLKIDEAEGSFERALEANPTSAHARVGLGQVSLLRDDPTDAVRWFRDALQFAFSAGAREQIEDLIETAEQTR